METFSAGRRFWFWRIFPFLPPVLLVIFSAGHSHLARYPLFGFQDRQQKKSTSLFGGAPQRDCSGLRLDEGGQANFYTRRAFC
jgi:hypothetical protein